MGTYKKCLIFGAVAMGISFNARATDIDLSLGGGISSEGKSGIDLSLGEDLPELNDNDVELSVEQDTPNNSYHLRVVSCAFKNADGNYFEVIGRNHGQVRSVAGANCFRSLGDDCSFLGCKAH